MGKAGGMLAGEGPHPRSKGARTSFSPKKRTVTGGAFSQAKELLAGFWLIRVKSKAEAIEWASRVPFAEGEIELRQVFEASDFPPEIFPPEDAAREEALRAELQRR